MKLPSSPLAAFAVLLGLSAPAPARSQATVVPDRVACEPCGLRLTLEATLGDDDGPGALAGHPASVARDGRGRFFVVQQTASEVVKVYDASGAFLRDVGGPGEGPGEFSSVTHAEVGPADSLYVFDFSLGRVSVFGRDLTFARSFRLTGLVEDAMFVGPETLLVEATMRAGDGSRHRLHLIRTDGEFVRSLGPAGPVHEPGAVLNRGRHVMAWDARSEAVWTNPKRRFDFRIWSPTGELLDSLRREADWFEPYERRTIAADRVDPLLVAMTVTEEGLLRVAVRVADTAWSERLPEPLARGGRRIYPVEGGTGMYDRIVEDIDPARGVVVRRVRIQAEIHDFLAPDLAYAYRLEGPGYPRIDIWRIRSS